MSDKVFPSINHSTFKLTPLLEDKLKSGGKPQFSSCFDEGGTEYWIKGYSYEGKFYVTEEGQIDER